MPVHECTEKGRPGYQYGSQTCYTYAPGDEAARRKAKEQAYLQGAAIEASQQRRGEKPKTVILDLLVSKQFETAISVPPVNPAILAQINALAREPVPEEQIYVAEAKLANDQYDRSHERFPREYLERFAQTIPGKALLPGHDQSAVPIGRWLDGRVEQDAQGVQHLIARFYVAAKSDLATRLRLGIAKDVSIRFKAAGRTCDLCGEAYDGPKRCEHNKGQEYDGRLCTVTYSGDPKRVEALEGSLVWLACQNGAQVVGAKAAGAFGGQVLEIEDRGEKDMLKEEEVAALVTKAAELESQNKALTARAAEGDAYREHLKGEIARKMSAAKGDKDYAETILKTLATADIEQLKAWDKIAQEQFDQKFPPSPQSQPLGTGEGHSVPAPNDERPPLPFDPHASLRGRF